MAVDDTQLYVTQEASVFIYSLKDFKLVKKFGSAGQGPQEFFLVPTVPLTIDVQMDQIIAVSIRKVSYFTKQGEFIKEVKMKSMIFLFIMLLVPCLDLYAGIYDEFQQANRYYEAGDFRSAISIYEDILSRDTDDPDVHYNLGNAYFREKSIGRAILSYERALELRPRDEDIRFNLGYARSFIDDVPQEYGWL